MKSYEDNLRIETRFECLNRIQEMISLGLGHLPPENQNNRNTSKSRMTTKGISKYGMELA